MTIFRSVNVVTTYFRIMHIAPWLLNRVSKLIALGLYQTSQDDQSSFGIYFEWTSSKKAYFRGHIVSNSTSGAHCKKRQQAICLLFSVSCIHLVFLGFMIYHGNAMLVQNGNVWVSFSVLDPVSSRSFWERRVGESGKLISLLTVVDKPYVTFSDLIFFSP